MTYDRIITTISGRQGIMNRTTFNMQCDSVLGQQFQTASKWVTTPGCRVEPGSTYKIQMINHYECKCSTKISQVDLHFCEACSMLVVQMHLAWAFCFTYICDQFPLINTNRSQSMPCAVDITEGPNNKHYNAVTQDFSPSAISIWLDDSFLFQYLSGPARTQSLPFLWLETHINKCNIIIEFKNHEIVALTSLPSWYGLTMMGHPLLTDSYLNDDKTNHRSLLQFWKKNIAISGKWPKFQFQCIPSMSFQRPAHFEFEIHVFKCRNAHFFFSKKK